jgi:phosphatidylserine decarboxylase
VSVIPFDWLVLISWQVLGTDQYGWFGEHGKAQLIKTANLGQTPEKAFEELFECDPQAEHHGYASWDAFFTRHFRFGEGVRPVASPDDDAVIANPCESRTYKVAHDVKARERFWVKGQPYSVVDMLAHDPLAEHFVGGTVYQAFLSALSYHRWHTPVSGVIKKAFVVDGTYYSEPLFEDFTQGKGADEHTESSSQEYLTACATRAIVFIEADNPKIGLMAFMGVGMVGHARLRVPAGSLTAAPDRGLDVRHHRQGGPARHEGRGDRQWVHLWRPFQSCG